MITLSISNEELITEILKRKGLKELWEVQEKAVEGGLLDNKNQIIIAPTASGKTLTAELACYKCLKEKGRIVYLVPTRSLINDKVDDFAYLTDEYDVKGSPNNQKAWTENDIVITAFESFYKQALLNTETIRSFDLAIVDEFHLLYDRLRGFTLEKIMTLLKIMNLHILCLSATFEDKDEIAAWLDANVIEIPKELRRVPLKHSLLKVENVSQMYGQLTSMGKEPYIIFCNTRDNSKSRALTLAKDIKDRKYDQTELIKEVQETANRQNLVKIENDLVETLSKGVAFHHSGLNIRVKKLVETKFLNRKVDYLFSTTGLAYGMNLPARTVVLCDLKIYNVLKGRQDWIPVHLYQQMAGRAGRPQFGTDGYSIILTKNKGEERVANDIYIPGNLSKAISHINEDSYFRKAILELIYSDRGTPEAIINFFKNTFYNFQSENTPSPFSKFDLNTVIRIHVKFLENNEFIRFTGAPGYRLTDLGKVTLDYLFSTFSPYDLAPFMEIKQYLEERGEIRLDFDLIYKINQLFYGTLLSKNRGKKINQIVRFYEDAGIEDIGHPEYSAYAYWNGWLTNMPVDIIEDTFNVNTSTIDYSARELSSLIKFIIDLSKVLRIDIDSDLDDEVIRVSRGIKKEEIPFVKIRRFGRTLIRNLNSETQERFTQPPWNYSGSTLEILKQMYNNSSKEDFVRDMGSISQISGVRGQRIYDFIEKQ